MTNMGPSPAGKLSTGAIPGSRDHWEARYHQGPRPWDTRITPPEVEEFWAQHAAPAGALALDIGCGPGTNVAYLARRGLRAVGIDLAGRALTLARQRIGEQDPSLLSQIDFVQADVSRLPFAGAAAYYILDVGCLHGLDFAIRQGYAQGVMANLAPGGYYHLYAFDRTPEDENNQESSLRGMRDGEVESLFASLTVIDIQRARPDRRPCRWYLLQRPR